MPDKNLYSSSIKGGKMALSMSQIVVQLGVKTRLRENLIRF